MASGFILGFRASQCWQQPDCRSIPEGCTVAAVVEEVHAGVQHEVVCSSSRSECRAVLLPLQGPQEWSEPAFSVMSQPVYMAHDYNVIWPARFAFLRTCLLYTCGRWPGPRPFPE